jgi:hypothetical protein
MINFKRAHTCKNVHNAKLRHARGISVKVSSAKPAPMPIISPIWSIGKLEFCNEVFMNFMRFSVVWPVLYLHQCLTKKKPIFLLDA